MRRASIFAAALLLAGLSFTSYSTQAQDTKEQRNEPKSRQNLIREVRHQLVLLPYYSVFDNLSFRVEGDTVTLEGQVVRPTLKSDAEGVVKNIEGIGRVVNNIEVLPLSGFDDSIRVRTFRAIFRSGGLHRYALGANPSIHIIVNRGRVTLEGFVANKMDRQLAYFAANQVSGVFAVTNNLRLDSEGAESE